MSRIRISLPEHFPFSVQIPIRITDLNYGGHVGNDTILSLVHEARMMFLKSYGYTEMQMEGVGMIMSDAGIEFKSELFYGDVLTASVAIGNISGVGFDLFYKLEKESKLVALVKTGMICFDYSTRKVARLPEKARLQLER